MIYLNHGATFILDDLVFLFGMFVAETRSVYLGARSKVVAAPIRVDGFTFLKLTQTELRRRGC